MNSLLFKPKVHIWKIFLILTFLLTFLCLATSTEYYNAGDNSYEYYGDYDNLYDAVNDVEGDPAIYDYYEPESVSIRPKKSIEEPKLQQWTNASLVDESTTECEPTTQTTTTECEPITTPCITTTPTTTTTECEPETTTTTCRPVNTKSLSDLEIPTAFQAPTVNNEQERKAKELRQLVQHLYIAQARVQLEASEIKKAQAIANEAQQQLEESANHVRAVTAALQNAQQEVASSAIRAQTAQLQLAAHDQLLFAARQDVDALSSQMVGLQAAEGIAQPKVNFDIGALMNKLRQPLTESDKPTPVPTIAMPGVAGRGNVPAKKPLDFLYYDYYYDY